MTDEAAMKHPLARYQRTTLWHLLHHYVEEAPASATIYTKESEEGPADLSIAVRLLNVFRLMVEHETLIPPEKRPNAGIWEMVKHEFHGDFYKTLASNDAKALAHYLRNSLRGGGAYGFGPGPEVFRAMREEGDGRDANVLMIIDRLASLAVAIGVLPHENPEQGHYGTNLRISVTDLTKLIQAGLGTEIFRPPIMGIFGINVGPDQVIDVRVPDDVYAAFRLSSISHDHRLRSVCEIGAGFGGVAFQFWRMAQRPFGGYTIIDLPLINILQGFFLMKIFGGDAVKMFGEDVPDRDFNILPYWEFANRTRKFDIVFNRDSLPEMPEEVALEYLAEISERKCVFLSINQESEGPAPMGQKQLIVHRLMKQFAGMRSGGRHPHWIRKGYVEEIFMPVGGKNGE
jgi:hypothetical protein